MSVRPSQGSQPEAEQAISVSFQKAVAFPLSRVNGLGVPTDKAVEWAQQEAAFGTIPIDDNGMSAGMKLNLLQPIRSIWAEWRQARADFDNAIEPKMKDILAVASAEADLEETEMRRAEELVAIEKRLEKNPDYIKSRDSKDTSYRLWKEKQDIHSGREATTFSYSVSYLMLIACIGVAEWFINYDVLLEFSGVPAIAAGSTIILGVLLAFAAHGYGELLKQWSNRFGEGRNPRQRARDWRFLGLSSTALVVVLTAAGFTRYSAAVQILITQSHHSLLSDVGVSNVNPLRDVLISLLANVAAWIVGVFLSYIAHDDDPEYAAATRQWNKAHSVWAKLGRIEEANKRHIERKYDDVINAKRSAAKTRAGSVEVELNKLKQVNLHEAALARELEEVLRSNIATYRDALTRVLLGANGKANAVTKNGNTAISPFEINAMELPDGNAIQQLLAA